MEQPDGYTLWVLQHGGEWMDLQARSVQGIREIMTHNGYSEETIEGYIYGKIHSPYMASVLGHMERELIRGAESLLVT